MNLSRKLLFTLIISLMVLAALPACSTPSQSGDVHLNMASMDHMPAEVQSAPVTVQEAYQFNVANPEVMKNIPCYCGCGAIGHASNYACYVSHVDEKGNITFDNHALGCSICVDITQDVMRLLREGKSTEEARAFIDATYSKYGPSNIP
ncbi:MAG TPA: PCYCGC motif-containing (lipo)protein [Anaerolineales bacterium]|nr:PCYCGC motif-containing (lipo)protein [Anaerolineales bacterium]